MAHSPKAAHLETEFKYRLLTSDFPATWMTSEQLFDDWRLGPPVRVHVQDTYLDTRSFAFLRAGFVLRVRRTEDKWLLGLKEMVGEAKDGAVRRFEFERPLEVERSLSADGPSIRIRDLLRALDEVEAPAGLRSRLERSKPNEALVAFMRLEQERCKRLAFEPDRGEPVAEVSFDQVDLFAGLALGPIPANLAGPRSTWRVVEVEALTEDAPGRLVRLHHRLTEDERLAPETTSKPVLALRALAEEEQIASNMHMAEAGRAIWRRQLVALLIAEAGSWRGEDPEAVHDMRVAIRRMRAAARVFGPFFAKKAIRPHLKTLRKTARVLGAARDLDVGLAKLDLFRTERTEVGGLEDVAARWQEQRAAAYARVQKWLDSDRYARFIADFAAFCTTPEAGQATLKPGRAGAPPPHQVRHVMPEQILGHFLRMRAYEVVVPVQKGEDVPEVQGSPEVLHALRIDGKRLRYSLEFVRPLLGSSGEKLIDRLKRLQDVLGELNDAVVAQGQVQALQGNGIGGPGVEAYLAHQEEVIQAQMAAFWGVWRRFLARKNRRRLARALAEL